MHVLLMNVSPFPVFYLSGAHLHVHPESRLVIALGSLGLFFRSMKECLTCATGFPSRDTNQALGWGMAFLTVLGGPVLNSLKLRWKRESLQQLHLVSSRNRNRDSRRLFEYWLQSEVWGGQLKDFPGDVLFPASMGLGMRMHWHFQCLCKVLSIYWLHQLAID